MKTLGYYNGVVDTLENSRIPMLDRACYFGDGVFNVAYARNYKIFALTDHIDQLFQSAAQLQITPDFSKDDLANLLCELVHKLDTGNLWVYFQLSRGTALRLHAFPEGQIKPNLMIMIKPAEIRDIRQTVRCITAEDNRHNYCHIKTLNYLSNVLAAQAAEDAGADEAILVRDGVVTECVHANLAILKGGRLITHPADSHIYAGTGRKHMLKICESLGIPTEERCFTMEEMLAADEVFRISGSSLCMQITEIDSVKVGGKDAEHLQALQNALLQEYLSAPEA